MPVLNVERSLPPVRLDHTDGHLIARQAGFPFRPTGRPSGWVGPPPWVVRPTAGFPPPFASSSSPPTAVSSPSSSSSPPASSSSSPLANSLESTGVPASAVPSGSSSPMIRSNEASNEDVASRNSQATVGAIVGGVLGGFALIAAFILAWRFLKGRERRAAAAQENHPIISPFRTGPEQQPSTDQVPGWVSPQDPVQTLSTLVLAGAGSQKGSFRSAPSIHRSPSTARSYTASNNSSTSPTITEDEKVLQAIWTLQNFLQPRMEGIPEHHSGAVHDGNPEPPSPPPPAYEHHSSSSTRPSLEKIRTDI